jgi:hypothetical protein
MQNLHIDPIEYNTLTNVIFPIKIANFDHTIEKQTVQIVLLHIRVIGLMV